MDLPPILGVHSAQLLLLWLFNVFLLCYHIHQWTRFLHPLLRFVLGISSGILLVFLCHLSYWRRERIHKEREAYARQMVELRREDLFKLLPKDIAESAASRRPDELHWLNVELAKAWPYLDQALADVAKEKLQPILDQYKMPLLEEIRLPSLSFGVSSPHFQGVKTEEMGDDEASIELDLDWKAERERILVKVKTIGPDFKVKVQNAHISGTAKLVFKPLKEEMPCFGAVLVALSDIPVIDFDLKITDGDINALPGIEKMIDNSIRNAIEDTLVWPNRIVCPVAPGDYSYLELSPVGILDVALLEATDVMNTDILGKSDCFILLYVRKRADRIKRSSTKKNTLHPVWNEGFRIEVDDPQYQSLTIQMMDEESMAQAEYIGRAVVPLKDFKPHEPKDLWLDVVENPNLPITTRRPRAHVHVIIVYEPYEDKPASAASQQQATEWAVDGGAQGEQQCHFEQSAKLNADKDGDQQSEGICRESNTMEHGANDDGLMER